MNSNYHDNTQIFVDGRLLGTGNIHYGEQPSLYAFYDLGLRLGDVVTFSQQSKYHRVVIGVSNNGVFRYKLGCLIKNARK